jgi:chromosome segregation ATPase
VFILPKKLIVMMLCLALVAGISPLTLAFEVIPAGHWAAGAVQSLNAEGVLIGYPDGTFKGDQAATRFELALALKRLENVVQGLSVSGQSQTANIGELRQLVSQLKDQVDKLQSDTDELKDQASQSEKAQARRDQFMNDLSDSVLALGEKVDALDTTKLADRVAALEKAYADVPTEAKVKGWIQPDLNALQGQVKGVQGQVDKLSQDNAALRQESDNQKKTINRLYWLLGIGVAAGIAIK